MKFLIQLAMIAMVAAQAPVRVIYQLPKYTFMENLRQRQNGSILFTRLDAPVLASVNPFTGVNTTIATFPQYLAVGGITEAAPDQFVIITGNFTLKPLQTGPGSYVAYTVDFRRGYGDSVGNPKITKIADLPQAAFIDGITYQPSSNSVFMADATLGVIYKLNLNNNAFTLAANVTLTRKCDPKEFEAVNGIKYSNGNIFFTNSGCGWLAKLPVTNNGTIIGSGTIIANNGYDMDDFDITSTGIAYATGPYVNQIFKIFPNGTTITIAGNRNQTTVPEPTAITQGRTQIDLSKGTIYVCTGGALADPINGTTVVGANILAIDLGKGATTGVSGEEYN